MTKEVELVEYLEKNEKERILSAYEEKALFDYYKKTNDRKALNILFERNIGLAIHFAKQYTFLYNGDYKEAAIVAQEGLFCAIRNYEEKGNKFSTYASICIRGYLLENRSALVYNKNKQLIRQVLKSTAVIESVYNEKLKADSENYQEMIDEITELVHKNVFCSNAKITKKDIKSLLNIINSLSYETTDDKYSLYTEDDYSKLENRELNKELLNSMYILTDLERKTLILRYGLEDGKFKTLKEVARKLGVTGERVRQLEVAALKKLKNSESKDRLKIFVK